MKPVTLLVVLLALGLAPLASARLGENLSQLKQRYGKPVDQSKKDVAIWLFETAGDGQLLFTATLNAKGLAIAEGLKPLKHAQLTEDDVRNFTDIQLAPYRGSKTLLSVAPGQKYTFAGRELACGADESVMVDDANGVLVVWNRGDTPSMLAVSRELLQQ